MVQTSWTPQNGPANTPNMITNIAIPKQKQLIITTNS